ncbi:hypothetical protein BH23BAC4_BH23BAC4_06000 [soil metagenome]
MMARRFGEAFAWTGATPCSVFMSDSNSDARYLPADPRANPVQGSRTYPVAATYADNLPTVYLPPATSSNKLFPEPPPSASARKVWNDRLDLLRRGRRLIFGTTVTLLLLAAIYCIVRPPEYRAYSVLLINSDRPTRGGEALAEGFIGIPALEGRRVLNQALILQQSPELARRAAERLIAQASEVDYEIAVLTDKGETRTPEQLAEHLQEKVVSVKPVGDELDAVRVEARGASALEAALIAQLYTEEYVARSRQTGREHIRGQREFLEDQFERRRGELDEVSGQIADYQSQRDAVGLDQRASSRINQVATLQIALDRARVASQTHSANLRQLEVELTQLQPSLERRVSSGVQGEIQRVETSISEIERVTEEIYLRYPQFRGNPNAHPDLTRYETQLAGLREQKERLSRRFVDEVFEAGGVDLQGQGGAYVSQLRQRISQERTALSGAEAEIAALRGRLGEAGAELQAIPARQAELAQFERTQQVLNTQVGFLQGELSQARLAEESLYGMASVLRPAQTPRRPETPNVPLTMGLAALLGLLGGLGIAVARHKIDTRLHDPADLAEHGFRVLAAVPYLGDDAASDQAQPRGVGGAMIHPAIVSLCEPMGGSAEAYRHLHASLASAPYGAHPPQIVLVTGARTGDGASTTAINLATVSAQADRRTLLIDADLRSPAVRDRLGLGSSPAYDGATDLNLVYWGTSVGNLYALTARDPVTDPEGLWSPIEFADLLGRLRSAFDFIVIDAPPSLETADAAFVAPHADAVVLVANAGETEAEQLAQAASEMQRSGGFIAGAVMNRFRPERASGFGSTYGIRFKGQRTSAERDARPAERATRPTVFQAPDKPLRPSPPHHSGDGAGIEPAFDHSSEWLSAPPAVDAVFEEIPISDPSLQSGASRTDT